MKKDEQPTNHHFIPISRIKGKGILGVCKVKRLMHELYHHLFGNMVPEEIIEHLNKVFWDNTYEIIIKKRPS